MHNPFTNREPLTPAQKKIVVCVALIVLIMGVSIGYDVLFGRAHTYDGSGSVVEYNEEEGDDEDYLSEEEEAGGENTADALGAGDVHEFDVFSLENATDEDLPLDYDAIEAALLNLFSEEGYDGHVGQTFSVVGVSTDEDTDSIYILSECDGFEYLRLYRDSRYLDYSAMAVETSSAWLTLMDVDGADTTVAEDLVPSSSSSSDAETETEAGPSSDEDEADE